MIKDILQEGFILKSNGYYKHAIESFYKALELDNTSSELLLEIADCYRLMGNEERALSYIEQILDKTPTHIGSLKLLKDIFITNKAWAEAEQTAKNIYSISQEPDDLAEILELLNLQTRYEEVFEYQADIVSPSILYEKSYAKLFLNELEEAELYINQAIDKKQENKFLLLKAKILFKKNQLTECIEIINGIKIDTADSEMLNFIGLVRQAECEFKTALNCFLEAIRINPDRDDLYYNCASTYFKMGDIQQAKKYYNLAISLAPDNQNYHFALANLYYSEKHYRRAMEELDYDFFEAKLLKAIILFDSGYLALSKKEFDKLIKEQPENELVIKYRSQIEEGLKI